ncbi:MAG: ASKHA domain-containing protein [Candidatus Hydrogenedentota bacterium]
MNTKPRVRVTFEPTGRYAYEPSGTSILEAAGRVGIILEAPCGGHSTCGKCRVRVKAGISPPTAAESQMLTAEELAEGYRLACQSRVESNCTVEILSQSTLSDCHKILMDNYTYRGRLKPVVRKLYFKLRAPTRNRSRSDLDRLRQVIGNVDVSLRQLRHLPAFLRANEWRGTALLAGNHLLRLERGDTTDAVYGVAFDIGTTTLVGTLMDLSNNEELAVTSEMNPQVTMGDDVISRIMRVQEDASALEELQATLVETLNGMIMTLAEQCHLPNHNIYDITVAGNTTMQQLLCGLDPRALAESPYTPVFSEAMRFRAGEIGLQANRDALLYIFPQIGGFVGGDTVAAVLAARLAHRNGTTLMVDIGTNGEIVLAKGGRMYAASTAAGPAFEGARIRNGMRARTGAIEKVVILDDVELNVIGNARPTGICGTALIDAVAELLRWGLLDRTGRFVTPEALPAHISQELRERLQGLKAERRFILAYSDETSTGKEIAIWQRDIRELQLAAGAIRAGIDILLERFDLAPNTLDEVLLTGAFGNFIRRSNARRIGLLPQVACSRIKFIGNAASLGAKLALLSLDEQKEAKRICQKTQHVDLSLDSAFARRFADAMLFPDGDLDVCLTVPASFDGAMVPVVQQ